MIPAQQDILRQLQKDILPLQGMKHQANGVLVDLGLGPMAPAFPQGIFPLGVVHEFVNAGQETTAATGGFVSGLLSGLMQRGGATVWISARRTLFPPALRVFGIYPVSVVFIDVPGEKEALWAAEEALKCAGLAAVVAEVKDLSFTASRRLQLVTESSGVTGFLLRHPGRPPGTNACVARWKISGLPSESNEDLPGVGFPRWQVELVKIRNGRPGAWPVEWCADRFFFPESISTMMPEELQRKAG